MHHGVSINVPVKDLCPNYNATHIYHKTFSSLFFYFIIFKRYYVFDSATKTNNSLLKDLLHIIVSGLV